MCDFAQGQIQRAAQEGAIVALFAYLQAEVEPCGYLPGGAGAFLYGTSILSSAPETDQLSRHSLHDDEGLSRLTLN